MLGLVSTAGKSFSPRIGIQQVIMSKINEDIRLEEAKKLMRQGEYEDAIGLFQSLLQARFVCLCRSVRIRNYSRDDYFVNIQS